MQPKGLRPRSDAPGDNETAKEVVNKLAGCFKPTGQRSAVLRLSWAALRLECACS